MRLVDADEFEKRIKPYDTNDRVDMAMYLFAHTKMISTSTVDAIPVEWIKEWSNNYCDDYQENLIKCLLKTWEKANGRSK